MKRQSAARRGALNGEENTVSVKQLRFITFEGGEGGGKSTQILRLREQIASLGYEVVVTREPGGSPRGERIREFILSGKAKPYGAFAEAVLFSAARIDHIRTIIAPALQRGAFVICDRFADSTRAYQGVLGDIDADTLVSLEHVAIGSFRPGLTLILDVSPEIGLGRANARRVRLGGAIDRFEGEDILFHLKLRQAFLDIAVNESQRCHVISAEQPEDIVADEIWQVVQSRLLEKTNPEAQETREHHGKR